jgi:exodeoxyribonuclease V beta subunit
MNTLNPLTLPLDHNALIEASAGTGKTYTITTLYLRAVLGLINANDNEPLAPIAVDKLLVVTFTKAATRELHERVRTKLKEAQHGFIEMQDKATNMPMSEASKLDPNLIAVLNEFVRRSDDETPILKGYQLISDAITLMDDAAIFTIHSFSNRALQQFAFETKSPFEHSMENDNRPYIDQALYDFWREFAVPMTGLEFFYFHSKWATPTKLVENIRTLFHKQVQIIPAVNTKQYTDVLRQVEAVIGQIHSSLEQSDFAELLGSNKSLKKKITDLASAVSKVAQQCQPDISEYIKLSEKLCTSSLTDLENYKKDKVLFTHPLTEDFETLFQQSTLLNALFDGYWLAKAKQYIEEFSVQAKQDLHVMTQDDPLLQLNAALSHGEYAKPLLDAIRQQYPLGFIDEFQDTDPIQFSIFNKIFNKLTVDAEYQSESDVGELPEKPLANASAMVMIGDPKQAIYKFRGADIFTYIKAKQQLPAQQCFTLDKNYRSHPQLINAVNQFFLTSKDPFDHQAIPFVEVGAGQKDVPHILLNEQSLAQMTVVNLVAQLEDEQEINAPLANANAQTPLARYIANDIYDVLNNNAKFSGSDVAVKAGDIAILVRKGSEAKIVQNELAKLNIKSVFLSKESIFKSRLAADLLRVVMAIHESSNERLVKAAVATQYFGYSLEEQFAIQQHDHRWHDHLLCFDRANQLWIKRQVSAAIQVVMEFSQGIAQLQLQGDLFERLITDHRQLLELLQQEAMQHSSLEPLVVWFKRTIAQHAENSVSANEDTSLRLESDQDLVQIVTMHGSKGLEYPIVYVPFATNVQKERKGLYYDEATSSLIFSTDKKAIEKADKERLAEDLRLLYVAMTRAKQRLVLGCFNLKEKTNSKNSIVATTAFGRLVLNQMEMTYKPTAWYQALQNKFKNYAEVICLEAEKIHLSFAKLKSQVHLSYDTNKLLNLPVRRFEGDIRSNWQVLSYSGIVGGHEEFVKGVTDEPDVPGEHDLSNQEIHFSDDFRFQFPKGANAGSCLHFMLEHLDFTKAVSTQSTLIEGALVKFGLDSELLIEGTITWMQDVIETQLQKTPAWSLSSLSMSERLDEMEFHLNFKRLSSDVLGNALRKCGFEGSHLNHIILNQKDLTGLIKGFIDLTAYKNGQYFIIDYKSNYLGGNIKNYESQSLELAMTDHNYHLQLLIYSYALHLWLQKSVPNYDYQRHVGGGLYLFLRGMSKKLEGNGVYDYKVPFEVIEFLDNALHGGA